MALTGIFLILFLVVHLAGNLQLLKGDGGVSFNLYSEFMGHNPLIQTISIANFALILTHIVVSLVLTQRNRKARPVQYAFVDNSSTWSSRNMGILGTIILLFLVFHLQAFYFPAKTGRLSEVTIDGVIVENMYEATVAAFTQWWIVLLYVVSMVGLGFHLWHGFQSAFRTLGIDHPKYFPFIKWFGKAFSILIPLGFAIIPVYMFVTHQ
jgi:succinate dehydrogenase / fumarate reductase cytochrome b subunit